MRRDENAVAGVALDQAAFHELAKHDSVHARKTLTSREHWDALTAGREEATLGSRYVALPDALTSTRARDQIAREGFGILRGAIRADAATRLGDKIVALCRHGWDAAFALVFDETWIIGRQLIELLQATVNPNLVFSHEMYAFCVDATLAAGRSRGVEPHRDRGVSGFDVVNGQRLPRHATAWVALSQANEHNGCIYVLPASVEGESYFEGRTKHDENAPAVALEASPGDVLMWSGQAVHWGGAYDRARARGPRVAIAFAGTHRDVARSSPLASFEIPMGPTSPLPPLEQRLRLIRTISEFLYPPRPGSALSTTFALLDQPPRALAVARPRSASSRRSRLDRAIALGIDYLDASRERSGLFHDFRTAPDKIGSTEWVSGFIGAHIGPIPEGRDLAAEVTAKLAPRARPNGGFAFREGTLEDCDSTAWVLLASLRCGARFSPDLESRALEFILSHQADDGGFATYGEAGRALFGSMAPRRGWFEPQACVTAAALLALLESGRGSTLPRLGAASDGAARYLSLGSRAEVDASWTAYWWSGAAYATCFATRALASAKALSHLERDCVRSALRERQSDSGGFGSERGAPAHPFATALGLSTFLVREGDGPVETEMLDAAIGFLLSNQRVDGSFPGSAELRVPGGISEETMTLVDAGPFTTATALSALDEVRSCL